MAKHRSPGEGSITPRRKDGKILDWQGRLVLPNGKRKAIYGKTRAEAQRKLAELKREVEAGYHGTLDAEQSVRTFFESWHTGREARLGRKTAQTYRYFLRLHLDIGDMALTEVKPVHIQRLYATKAKTLAPTSITHLHSFLHAGFKEAVKMELIPRNPTEFVTAPGMKVKEYEIFTRDQVLQLLQAANESDAALMTALALTTGMREAEVLGLAWTDIDLDKGNVKLRHTIRWYPGKQYNYQIMKSRYSRRTIPIAPHIIALLMQRAVRQQDDKELVEDAWEDKHNLVFTLANGQPLRPDWLTWRYERLLKKLGLPYRRFHDLRHTFATLLIEDGVPIRVVSELLGHSSIEITLHYYGHVTPKMQDQAVATIAGWLPEGGINGSTDE